jgi:hypothetical protein
MCPAFPKKRGAKVRAPLFIVNFPIAGDPRDEDFQRLENAGSELIVLPIFACIVPDQDYSR